MLEELLELRIWIPQRIVTAGVVRQDVLRQMEACSSQFFKATAKTALNVFPMKLIPMPLWQACRSKEERHFADGGGCTYPPKDKSRRSVGG